MNRDELLQKILEQKKSLTYSYYKLLSTPQDFYHGEKMHTREVDIISEIGEKGLDNISELSDRLKITKGAVSQYLKKLEKKGFIERKQECSDKRQYSVRLTEKEKEVNKRYGIQDQEHYEKAYPFFEDFTDEELRLVFKFEEKFAEFGREALLSKKEDFSK